jgi:hypothetical protein
MEISSSIPDKVLPWQGFLLSHLLVCITLAADGRCCGYCMFRVHIQAHVPLLCARIRSKQPQAALHSRPAAENIKIAIMYPAAMQCLDNTKLSCVR